MGKVLAIIFVIIFIWWAIPHFARGEWIAPTAIAPDSWVTEWDKTGYASALATPPQGYGWFHYDAWNNPPLEGRPVTKSDLKLKY